MSTSGKLHTNGSAPLQGRRILVTRAADQIGAFSTLLQQRGATVVECPTIALVPPQQWDEVDAALSALNRFDWLILTSANGVRFFFARLQELGLDTQSLQGCKVCAVGPKTAELLTLYGIRPDLVPMQFTGEGVVAAFQGIGMIGKQVLFPKADGARDLIPQQLGQLGAVVTAPVIYRNIMPESLPDEARNALEKHALDAVVFSSPSTVHNLSTLVGGIERLHTLLHGVAVASIGPITSQACRKLGLQVTLEPLQATLDDLVTALERYFPPH